MPKEHKYAFLDTNIFLHFQFFTEIDWIAVLQAKSVTLIIPPIVARELDKHKYNHSSERIKDRATKITKKFAEIFRSKGEVRPKVNIQFERIEPQTEFETYNLSKDSQDDHLIASILRFQIEIGHTAVLITNDFSLLIKAHQLNIEVIELPEIYQTKSEENPDKKKIQKLEKRIADFENRVPNLKISSLDDKSYLSCKSLGKKVMSQIEVNYELDLIKQKHPYLHPKPTNNNFNGLGFTFEPFSQIVDVELPNGGKRRLSPNQINHYNEELDEFYEKYSKYLLEKVDIDKVCVRTLICELKLSNIGKIPAEDIDVYLYFPKSLKIVDKKPFSYPEPPKVPDYPLNYNMALYGSSSMINISDLRDSAYLSLASTLPNNFTNSLATRKQKIKHTDNGDILHFWLKNLKHGHSGILETFYCVFPEEAETFSCKISYKITAANISKPIEKVFNFKMTK